MQSVSSYNIDKCYYYRSKLVYISLNKASNSKDFKIKEFKPKAQISKPLNLITPCALTKKGIPRPLIKFKKRKNIRGEKNRKITSMLVTLVFQSLKLTQQIILVKKYTSNKILIRSLTRNIIKKITIQIFTRNF